MPPITLPHTSHTCPCLIPPTTLPHSSHHPALASHHHPLCPPPPCPLLPTTLPLPPTTIPFASHHPALCLPPSCPLPPTTLPFASHHPSLCLHHPALCLPPPSHHHPLCLPPPCPLPPTTLPSASHTDWPHTSFVGLQHVHHMQCVSMCTTCSVSACAPHAVCQHVHAAPTLQTDLPPTTQQPDLPILSLG